MKYLIAPDFVRKAESLRPAALNAITHIIAFIKLAKTIDQVVSGNEVEVRQLGREILSLKSGDIRVYATPTIVDQDEQLLLLDFAEDVVDPTSLRRGPQPKRFFASKDPRTNSGYNPDQNATIDPRRNMTIDPRRNMTIDPRRNMTIDPRRNMTIDPKRNMTIDPRRNMSIDPRRNMSIDPRRNMMIDPRRNSYFGGPYLYSLKLEQVAFVVRANDKVSLIFDMSAQFIEYYVSVHNGSANIFDLSARWIGFLVPTKNEIHLRFDTQASWTGFIV